MNLRETGIHFVNRKLVKLIASILTIALMALLPFGCKEKESATGNDGVRPAVPPPSTAGESDTALTQTVEIGEERSPAEGGVLTDEKHLREQSNTATSTATAGTTSAPATSP